LIWSEARMGTHRFQDWLAFVCIDGRRDVPWCQTAHRSMFKAVNFPSLVEFSVTSPICRSCTRAWRRMTQWFVAQNRHWYSYWVFMKMYILVWCIMMLLGWTLTPIDTNELRVRRLPGEQPLWFVRLMVCSLEVLSNTEHQQWAMYVRSR
jgi:hypothetical protein